MFKCRNLLFLLILSCTALAQEAPTPQRIAYIKDQKVSDIWHGPHLIVSTLGGNEEKLISELASFPSWSPDGKRLAYFGNLGGPEWRGPSPVGVMLYDFNTRKSRMLLDVKTPGQQRAAWSPDGSQLAFAMIENNKSHLVMINVETGRTQVLNLAGGIECAADPSWAPDGKSLVVYECSKDKRGLALIDPNGRLLRRLTEPNAGGYDRFPAWSPDGQTVAFVSSRGDTGKPDPQRPRHASIYVINTDGTGLRSLVTHNELSMLLPNWSSDGKLLAVEVQRGGLYFPASNFDPVGTKVLVVNVADGRVLATLGENTAQPALAPR